MEPHHPWAARQAAEPKLTANAQRATTQHMPTHAGLGEALREGGAFEVRSDDGAATMARRRQG